MVAQSGHQMVVKTLIGTGAGQAKQTPFGTAAEMITHMHMRSASRRPVSSMSYEELIKRGKANIRGF